VKCLGAASLAGFVTLLGIAFFVVGALGPPRGAEVPPPTRVEIPSLLPTGGARSLEGTISALQQRLKDAPDDGLSFASLGLAYLAQGRATANPTWFPKAESAFQKALDLDPERSSDALIGMAMLDNARHDFVPALQWAKRAVEFDAFDSDARGALGDALIELGRYDAGFAAYQKMVDLRPELSSFARIAYARELLGDTRGAFQAWRLAERAGGTSADLAWVDYQIGDLHLRNGHVGTARSHLEDALRLAPESHLANVGMARVEAALERWPRAIHILRQVIARYPAPSYVALLGDIYARAGDNERAQDQYSLVRVQQQLAADSAVLPDVEVTLFNVDHGYDADLTVAEARDRYERHPSIRAADALGWALWAEGKPGAALRFAREALQLGTKDASFRYHLGVILNSLGHEDGARRNLRAALDIDPDFSVLNAPNAQDLLMTLEARR
jgi:tetratricopeptide (TPR) repeat protein